MVESILRHCVAELMAHVNFIDNSEFNGDILLCEALKTQILLKNIAN